MNKPKEYGLFYLSNKYGWKNIILCPDLILSTIITIIITYYYHTSNNFSDNIAPVTYALIGANAGLLGIVLAGFAIMIALMHGEYKDVLKEVGLFDDTVFLFCYDSLLLSLGLIFTIFLGLILPVNVELAKYIFISAIFFSLYGLFSVVFLLLLLKELAMLKGES